MLTCSARKAPKWMKRVKYEQLRLGRIDPTWPAGPGQISLDYSKTWIKTIPD